MSEWTEWLFPFMYIIAIYTAYRWGYKNGLNSANDVIEDRTKDIIHLHDLLAKEKVKK